MGDNLFFLFGWVRRVVLPTEDLGNYIKKELGPTKIWSRWFDWIDCESQTHSEWANEYTVLHIIKSRFFKSKKEKKIGNEVLPGFEPGLPESCVVLVKNKGQNPEWSPLHYKTCQRQPEIWGGKF